jgi:phenylacetate-CoA ligase
VWRALARFGVPLGAPVLRVWGTQLDLHRRIRDLAKDLLLNRRTLSGHHVTDETARACARLLARRSVEALYGFTSAVTLLAHRLEARAAGQALRVVVVTGERLEPAARRAIERSFAAAVCQEYGCTEAGPIAHECPEGSLHVNEENVILECRTCGTPLYPETGCTHAEGVLVTELNNRVLPLLRYALADGVRVLPRPCPCGRASLRLAPVIGRESEAVLTRDGSALSGMFFDYLPKYVASEVVELQFVQEAPGSLCVLVVAGPAYRDAGTRERLRALIDDAARGGLDVLVREVDAVPREPSGKIKLVKVSAR